MRLPSQLFRAHNELACRCVVCTVVVHQQSFRLLIVLLLRDQGFLLLLAFFFVVFFVFFDVKTSLGELPVLVVGDAAEAVKPDALWSDFRFAPFKRTHDLVSWIKAPTSV